MSQYKRLFASTRIPTKGKDVLESWPDARHIIVLRYAAVRSRAQVAAALLTVSRRGLCTPPSLSRNHFYKLDVLHADGTQLTQAEILAGLQAIVNDQSAPDPLPIGVRVRA